MALVLQGGSPTAANNDPEQLPCAVPAAPGSRLAFSWGTGCQLHVAEVACPATGQGGHKPFAGSCEWGTLASTQRRIAYQVLPLYTRLQRSLMQSRGGGGAYDQARTARQLYSDAVYDVLMETSSMFAARGDEDVQVACEAALWQLLSFFFLSYEDLDRGAFPEALAALMLQHGALFNPSDPSSDTPPGMSQLHAQASELLSDPRVDTSSTYWGTLHRLVLLGQLDSAIALLLHHPMYQQAGQDEGMAKLVQGFEEVYDLLSSVPRLDRQTGSAADMQCSGGQFTDNVVLFNEERAKWESRVSERYQHRGELLEDLKEADPAAAKGLAALLQMLCTDFNRSHPEQSAACKQMAKAAANWLELLTGMLLWQHRDMPLLRLKNLAEVAVRMQRTPLPHHTHHADRDLLDFFQEMFMAACQQEVQEVIRLTTNSPYVGLQFVVHSFEVLRALPEAARVISRPLPHMGCDQAESFLLNYVEVLLGARVTALLGAEYLAWCPVYGGDALEATLDKSPHMLADQQTALKALALARRHDLTAAAYNLCKRLAASAVQSGGQLAAALQWALQAQDGQLCAELVAPLVTNIQQQLMAQVGNLQAAPLQLPELQDLQPLLLNLPGSTNNTTTTADDTAAAAAGGYDGYGDEDPTTSSRGVSRLQRYPELQFLRAMLQLQQALTAVKTCQQPLPAPAGAGADLTLEEVAQQQQLQVAALEAAYASVRQPVQELLLEGLAPAALRLPLLLYISPLLDSAHMPFSRAEVMGLLRVMGAGSMGLPSAAAAVLDGSHGNLPGVSWSGGSKAGAAAVNAARLALCRGLARAHVVEASVEAW